LSSLLILPLWFVIWRSCSSAQWLQCRQSKHTDIRNITSRELWQQLSTTIPLLFLISLSTIPLLFFLISVRVPANTWLLGDESFHWLIKYP
jgi:hypothetical protein